MKTNKQQTLQEKEIIKITKKLDKELSKSGDKTDMTVVNECFRRLDELQGNTNKKTDDELMQGLEKAKRNGDRIRAEFANNEIARSCNTPAKMPFKRRFAVAAMSVLLVIGLSFSALALSLGGYSKAWACISDSIKTLFNTQNSENTVDGITIIKGDYYKAYDNIEELLKEENIDIFYPCKLPQGIQIENIRYLDLIDDRYRIFISFNSTYFNMSFYNYHQNNLDKLSEYTIYKTNALTFYILSKKENETTIYMAIAQNDTGEYVINSNTYENLILIISNLKEVQK